MEVMMIRMENETTEIIGFEADQEVNATIEYGETDSFELGGGAEEANFQQRHELNITGLNPGTKYYYRINITNVSDGVEYFDSFNSSFVTADYSLQNFVFAVLGDSRELTGQGTGVHAEIYSKLISYIIEREPAFLINVGDVVESRDGYPDTPNTVRTAWKEYTDVMWNFSDHIPAFIAIGNHENPGQNKSLKRYREVVIHPHNGNGSTACDPNNCYDETTYSFRYGNVSFIFLNTEEPDHDKPGNITGNQYDWFNETLHEIGYAHKFVFCHKPLVGSSRKPDTLSGQDPVSSAHLDELMYDNNVTAAFYGHNHYYCHNTTHDGEMFHITTGGAGAPQHAGDCTNYCLCEDPENPDYCFGPDGEPEYHYIMINITGNMMNATVYNHTNDVKRRFGTIMD